ncbi:MAG TPA: glycosyltransferase family 4 protein, partial [Gemmatales bacterium]|nr:glycosyltransferase family 4 protein [Gemmatales bacterium]
SQWKNSLPAVTTREDGFIVPRFPIVSYDAVKLGEAYQQIQQGHGNVSPEVERAYLQNSLGSVALIEALAARRHDFAAILTGPYLFKLMYEVVQHFTEQVLLAPCFHDEPLAKLRCFQRVYRQAGGLVFHSEPEARLTAELLGISQPRHAVVGTLLSPDAMLGDAAKGQARIGSPYLVYCGRYCPEKGLDRLLEYVEYLQLHTSAPHSEQKRNGPIKLVCMGQGPMKLPKRPWLIDAGFVSEQEKRDLLAGALALVNLSRNESLSIVALEAWSVKVPVIVDSRCSVLVDQVQRSQGGFIVQHAGEFTAAVEALLPSPCQDLRVHSEASNIGKQMGEAGHAYVRQHYLHPEHFADKLSCLVKSLATPLRDVCSQQGSERAGLSCATVWEERFAQLMEKVQLQEFHSAEHLLAIEPLQTRLHASPQMISLPVSIKLKNMGTTLLPAQGPAAAELVVRVGDQLRIEMTRREIIPLAKPIQPGKEALLIAAIGIPQCPGRYRVRVQIKQGRRRLASHTIPLLVSEQHIPTPGAIPLQPIMQEIRSLLGDATRLQKLPSDYIDVTEGRFASLKKAIKTKLLHNFRKALVEPAFRQQSALNEKLLAAICLLVEGQAAQDVTASQAQLLRQIRQLERLLKQERRARRKLERQIAQLADLPQLILTEGNAT